MNKERCIYCGEEIDRYELKKIINYPWCEDTSICANCWSGRFEMLEDFGKDMVRREETKKD